MRVFIKKTGVAIVTCSSLVLLFILSRLSRHGTGTLASGNSKTGRTVGALVHVIEEHHEALVYWFAAVENGALPKQGNILFHIDGHSDGADPFDRHRNPVYRMPRNGNELRLMMEKNDVFIQAAAGTGLINRFIWVWPPYCEQEKPYVSMNLEAGLMYTEDGELVACYCMQSKYIPVQHPCYWIKRAEHVDEDETYFPIDRNSCHDMTLGGIVEVVSTDKAIELAKSGSWIKASDSVILDIDEDYYACEAVSAPLYDAGMNEEAIEDLSYYIGKVLCTDNAKDEMEADRYFQKLLKAVQETQERCRSGRLGEETCVSKHALTEAVLDLLPDMTTTRDFMCFPKESTLVMFVNLVEHLSRCSNTQLQHIGTIGVCMYTSPRSSSFNRNDGMILCKGCNGPNSTHVIYHSTDEAEIKASTRHIKAVLTQPFIPRVVTVCRSVRDGYTPRKEFPLIELGLLDALKAVYPDDVRSDTVHYDSELLGGREGWYFRYHR
ncbi:uncharacterized protein LOC124141181 [Haliotis rufescens]|uniref:uncharacterized protein LOC124141181 n=1 Tax=Haliotis rufescens TaxID=6454 RepID=UPI00201EA687|nr:uncharacterized protein LOC124141181 [Haliotis rufescens]